MTFWVAGAAIGSAVIGGVVSSNAASKAAGAQIDSTNSANATQLQMYNQTRADQMPTMERGNAAGNQLSMLMGLSSGSSASKSLSSTDLVDTSGGDWRPNADLYGSNEAYKNAWDSFISGHQARFGVAPNLSRGSDLTGVQNQLAGSIDLNSINSAAKTAQDQANSSNPLYGSLNKKFSDTEFQADPGYDFRLSEGMKGVTNSAAARGGLLSGAALKASTQYNQNFASNEYSNAYSRYNADQSTQFNRLASIAGVGQTATAQVGQNAISTGNQVASNQIGAGNARASGYVGQANAVTGAIGQGWNMYQGNQLMNSLGNSGSSSNYANEMSRINAQL